MVKHDNLDNVSKNTINWKSNNSSCLTINKTYKITCNNLYWQCLQTWFHLLSIQQIRFVNVLIVQKFVLLYSSDMHHLDNNAANLFSEEGIYVALICTLYFEHKTKYVAPNLAI